MQHTVVKVHGKIGDYFALQAEGKAPYIQAMPECRPVTLLPSDHVVDIGAFIGEYAMRAAIAGCQVTAYEPTPLTYSVLTQNLQNYPNATAVNAAVVGGTETEVTFSLSKGNGTRNKISSLSNPKKITVPATSYAEAIKHATVVKIDVEGAEWEYPILENLAHLRAIIIEFHPKNTSHRLAAKHICEQIEAHSFTMVYPKTDEMFWDRFDKHGKRFSAHRAWIRS